MELKRVVVTGLGAITPIGNSVPEFWENLVNGVSGAGPITHFDASLFKTQFACEVKGFDVFVTAFLKKSLLFVMFVRLYKETPCYLLILTNSMEFHIKIRFQQFS